VIIVIGPEGTITYQSPSTEALLGYTDGQLVGRHFTDLIHPADERRVATDTAPLLATAGESVLIGCRLRHAEGRWVDVESNCRNLFATPEIGGIVVNSRDVSERKALEAQLQHRAFHDALTGLANRHLFRDRVDHAVARSQRHGGAFAVLFLDLDGFKGVNDSMGHQAGDQLLRVVGERLREATRGQDTPARLGGDEFAVLVEEMTDQVDAARVADRILETIRAPIELNGVRVQVDASIGIAVAGAEVRTADLFLRNDTDALLRNADIAMYMAKNSGRGRYEIFEPAMHVRVVERLKLESDLRAAIEDDQFELHYQPIVELATGAVAGAEALLRWRHPERGLVSPGEFIPAAEETGAIVEIGRWVLAEACRQLRIWDLRFPTGDPLKVSVNVSVRQLEDDQLVADVEHALQTSGICPSQLTLEITESAVMSDTQRFTELLQALKALGVHLAVDDFGTGYSNLAYMKHFPFDVLKIDRQFVDGLTRGTQDLALVQLIVSMGQTFGLDTVAEGIEEHDQLERFRDLKCTHGQGFLFAKPAPPDVFEDLLIQRELMPDGASPTGL
jgi:diguanylate cyclase (GGDEF)-like protein/PAS domain S-box-containing protein